MKTAVILSAHMRSFDKCLSRLTSRVFAHLGNVDFFVSTVADHDAHKANLLKLAFPDSRVEIESWKEQPDCIADLRAKGCDLPKTWTHGKPYMREKFWISVHPQAVARQLWQLEQGWNLFEPHAGEYSRVIRCRPDLFFHSADLNLQWPVAGALASTPWWGRFDGVNDRFAVLSLGAARAYFTTYSQIPAHLSRGGNLHPETLVKASLTQAGVEIRDTLGVLFSTLRGNGEIRPPEITGDDVAHLAANC